MWREVVLSSSRTGAGKREMQNTAEFYNTDQTDTKLEHRRPGISIIYKQKYKGSAKSSISQCQWNMTSTQSNWKRLQNTRTWDRKCRGYATLKLMLYTHRYWCSGKNQWQSWKSLKNSWNSHQNKLLAEGSITWNSVHLQETPWHFRKWIAFRCQGKFSHQ